MTIEGVLRKIRLECAYLTASYLQPTKEFRITIVSGTYKQREASAYYTTDKLDALLTAVLMQAHEHKRMAEKFGLKPRPIGRYKTAATGQRLVLKPKADTVETA